ncbi:LysR family transcriptional regulator, partial [Mesorhizobium sp.]|uniref:LysR family transcriptional regulator n=1 Tax=Mesorhizobium sp. TaxID=1871066 RepID=UPI0025C06926
MIGIFFLLVVGGASSPVGRNHATIIESKKSNCLEENIRYYRTMQTLDPDLLKTFLAFVDGGSLAKAASTVGRSPSAVTAQMQRLEEIVGEPLLAPQGRGRGLTPAGEDLVGHARRILAVHT